MKFHKGNYELEKWVRIPKAKLKKVLFSDFVPFRDYLTSNSHIWSRVQELSFKHANDANELTPTIAPKKRVFSAFYDLSTHFTPNYTKNISIRERVFFGTIYE